MLRFLKITTSSALLAAFALSGPAGAQTLTTAEQHQESNRSVAEDLLDLPYVEGEMPFRTMTTPAGQTYDIWAGPVVSDGQSDCRVMVVGEIASDRIVQSLMACRNGEEDWTMAGKPEDLKAEHAALIRRNFDGEIPEFGVGVNPLGLKN